MYDYTFFFVQLSVRENLTVVFKQLVFVMITTSENQLSKGCSASTGFIAGMRATFFCLYPDIPYPKLVLVKDKIVKTYSPRL